MKLQLLKKNVSITWLFSYFIVIVTLIIITNIFFIGIQTVVSNKINGMNKIILSNIRTTIDTILKSVEETGQQIEFSRYISSALSTSQNSDADEHYQLHQTMKYLRECEISSEYINNISLFLEESGYCVTSSSILPPSWSLQEMHAQLGINEEEGKILSNIDHRGFYIVPTDTGQKIIYAAPLPSIPVNVKKQGLLLISLNLLPFESKINQDDTSKKTIFILDHENNTLSLSNLLENFTFDFSILQGKKDSEVFKFENEKLVLTSLDSQVLSGKYIILDRYNEVYGELQILRILNILCMIICCFVGLGVSLYLTKKNYRPMRRLINEVSTAMGLKQENGINEYHFLNGAVSKAIAAKYEAEKQINDNINLIEDLYLIRLLQGDTSVIQKLHIVDAKNFSVAVLTVEDTLSFFENSHLPENDQQKLICFIIENCCQDFFKNLAKCRINQLDNAIIIIFNYFQDDTEKNHAKTLQQLEELHGFFCNKLKIKLSIALGNTCKSLEDISQSFLIAQEAMEMRMILGNNVVIDSSNITDFFLYYDYSIENEQDILHNLKNGNYAETRSIIFNIIDSSISSGMLSTQLSRCLFFDIIATIIKGLSQIYLDNHFLVKLNPIKRLLKCETFVQMKEELDFILQEVCDYIKQNDEDHDMKIFKQISLYINQHYSDMDLNVTTLSDHFNVSTTFLVKIFKKNAGVNPLDFINRTRITQSLEKLKNKKKTIEEVAYSVGYGSTHTYIRVFKKFYGETPGSWRERAQYDATKK